MRSKINIDYGRGGSGGERRERLIEYYRTLITYHTIIGGKV